MVSSISEILDMDLQVVQVCGCFIIRNIVCTRFQIAYNNADRIYINYHIILFFKIGFIKIFLKLEILLKCFF